MTSSYPAMRTTVITGSASRRGIGFALASRLGRAGWSLGLVDRDDAALRDRCDELRRAGAPVTAAAADVTDADEIDVAAVVIERELPPILALVNIAGISDPTKFLDTDLERWSRVLRANATGTSLMMKRFAPGMVERGIGRIVNLSSTAAQTGGGTYSATA